MPKRRKEDYLTVDCGKMRLKAITGIVLAVLLIGMLLSFLMHPVLADDVDMSWPPPFTDDGAEKTFPSDVATANKDTGEIKLKVTSSSFEGRHYGEAYIWQNFTYDHTSWFNWIQFDYTLRGDISVYGSALACFTVTLELWDRAEERRLFYDKNIELVNEDYNGSYSRTVEFPSHLYNNKQYGLLTIATAETDSQGSATITTIDFYSEALGYGINLKNLRVHHDHAPPAETAGGSQTGTEVRGEYSLKNDVEGATSLTFTSFNKDAKIVGWYISITQFSNATSSQSSDKKKVYVRAYDPLTPVPENAAAKIKVTQWLDQKNSMGVKDPKWSKETKGAQIGNTAKAMPDHYWSFGYPSAVPGQLGEFSHMFTMINDDSQHVLSISALSFLATMTRYENLAEIQFTGPVYSFKLFPQQHWYIPIVTDGRLNGGYIYFKYSIDNLDGSEVVCNAWGGHPVTSPPVGGVWVSVDKFSLLSPYIGLASTIVVATVATAINVKRAKCQKER